MYLVPVQYHGLPFPKNIQPDVVEVSAHFDKQSLQNDIKRYSRYSLHTEYSATKRKFSHPALVQYPELANAQENDVPLLWFNEQWAIEFAHFLFDFVNEGPPPDFIEIHPPFNHYCDIEQFLTRVSVFAKLIKARWGNTLLLLENRNGCRPLQNRRFLIKTAEDMELLSRYIDSRQLDLRFTLDIPQLLRAHELSRKKVTELSRVLNLIQGIRQNIYGIHLWGTRRVRRKGTEIEDDARSINKDNLNSFSTYTHEGDLTSFFGGDIDFKNDFLKRISEVFSDTQQRLLVLEINQFKDKRQRQVILNSILNDLDNAGAQYVTDCSTTPEKQRYGNPF